MSLKLKLFFLLALVPCFKKAFGQNLAKDTGVIYHIAYNGYTPNKDDKTLFWFTQNEIPKAYFRVELFCWNHWVNKGKLPCSGSPGRHKYKLKVYPHSGENIFRVVLVNDSNIRLASSTELHSVLNNTMVPKVEYTDKKGKEIKFSTDTDYEIRDSTGKIVKEGRGASVPYDDLDEGVYTLYYDNTTTTFRKKK